MSSYVLICKTSYKTMMYWYLAPLFLFDTSYIPRVNVH